MEQSGAGLDGVVIAVEITAALKRGDLPVVRRKAELYERVLGKWIDRIIVVTAFIHDRNPHWQWRRRWG